ncbi:hypothetical protein EGR52_13160 [bacterium]|nr:hypothetical protein [bacterium]
MNINFGATSDFNDDLMNKELITSMYPSTDIYDEYLVLGITINTNYVNEVIRKLDNKLNDLSVNKIDFKRKKNAQIATLILNYEDVENVNMNIQDNIIKYNEIITNYKGIMEALDIEDLNYFLDNLSLENIAYNVFMPKENQDV